MNRTHNPTILRVPVEVASTIFQLCVLPISIESPLEDFLEHRQGVLALGAVCRGWRRIALSSHQLWTTISLSLTSRFTRSHAPRWNEFLARSGQLRLSIYIYEVPTKRFARSSTQKVVHALVEAIKVHSHRLKNVRIDASVQRLSLFDKIANVSSPLEALQLRCPDEEHPYQDLDISINLNFRPKKLILYRVPFDLLSIKWNGIVEVDVTWIFIEECSTLLKQVPLLKHCRFAEILGSIVWDPPSNALVLPHLDYLDFDMPTTDGERVDPLCLDILFNTFTFPALQTLHLNLARESLPFDTLRTLLQRSTCTLRTLRIANTILETEKLIHLLQGIPSLETLTFDPDKHSSAYSPKMFFRAFSKRTTSQDVTRFLPNLCFLQYRARSPQMVPWKHVAPIFGPITEIRQGIRLRPLQKLQISLVEQRNPSLSRFTIDMTILPSLLDLLQAGIDLQVINEETGENVLRPRNIGT
ncbi:hypothetical protein CVT26_009948 [Gymnopilus dilepis]|uniref:F-box domain-containing protein n=1 Tax=Gymnopilus dilepis TaxID=231916 RepID=A0A409VL71_9AGAR|nr:hypothetical protein CVT26_009948 [Gymnopilus dilepis]